MYIVSCGPPQSVWVCDRCCKSKNGVLQINSEASISFVTNNSKSRGRPKVFFCGKEQQDSELGWCLTEDLSWSRQVSPLSSLKKLLRHHASFNQKITVGNVLNARSLDKFTTQMINYIQHRNWLTLHGTSLEVFSNVVWQGKGNQVTVVPAQFEAANNDIHQHSNKKSKRFLIYIHVQSCTIQKCKIQRNQLEKPRFEWSGDNRLYLPVQFDKVDSRRYKHGCTWLFGNLLF